LWVSVTAAGSVARGWDWRVACSVAGLTAAREAPGTALKPCSILATHDAHDMPSIGIVRETGLTEDAALAGVGAAGAGLGRIGVIVTICAGAWPMPGGPPLRTASGYFSKVCLLSGAQE